MTLLAITGAVITLTGLALVVVGTILAWKTETAKRARGKGFTEAVGALAKLATALAKHPVGIRLVFLGIVLVLLGAIMSGVSGLAS